MAKFIPSANIDAQLDPVIGTHIHVCSGQPTDFASIAGLMLAEQAIVGAQDKAAGDVSGRKVTTPQQADVPIAFSGDATHVAHSNGTDTLRRVTTCPTQTLTQGGTVTIQAHDHEVGAPT